MIFAKPAKPPERIEMPEDEGQPSQPACEHRREAVRLRKLADDRVVHVKQCLDCGRPRNVAKAALGPRAAATREWFDEQLRERWDAQVREFYRQQATYRQGEYQRQQAQESTEWWRQYTTYLETPEWQRKRALELKRAKGVCEGCGEGLPVEIHHLTYEHVGDEFLWELAAICVKCHDRIHPDRERWPQVVFGSGGEL